MLGPFTLAAVSLPLLAFVFLNPWLPSWGSRKVLHMGTGSLLMLTDVTDPLIIAATYLVTVLFISVVSVRKLHFSDVGDVGIINYLLFCSVCVTLGVPFVHVMPLFYADPMGAIVGRNVPTAKLVGDKSIGGTLAVFATAALTVSEETWMMRIWAGACIATIELFAGKWDNPGISAFLLLRYFSK